MFYRLMRSVAVGLYRPLGMFEGNTLPQAIADAALDFNIPAHLIREAAPEEVADVDRLVFLENVRRFGALIIADERNGRYHAVGTKDRRPAYDCDINDYVPIMPDDVAKRMGEVAVFMRMLANRRDDEASAELCAALIDEARNLMAPK